MTSETMTSNGEEILKTKKPYQSFDMVGGLFRNDLGTYGTAKNVSVMLNDTTQNNHTNLSFKKPTRADIANYLKNPEAYSKQLRNASNYLYEVSTQYRRLIDYFAKLLTLDYIIIPYKLNPSKVNTKTFETAYFKAVAYLQNMNIKHEMLRVLTVAYREDVYYGYILEEKDSFHIQKLDPDYCQITGIIDSCFIYSFNFAYFNSRETELENFPSEFRVKYEAYKKDNKLQWQQPDFKKQFCIKVTESIYPCPIIPFAGVFDYIFQILDYIDLQETREALDNYKVIGLKIPMDEEGNIQIDLDMAKDFYKQLCNVLPESVGAFMSPMDFQDIAFERSNAADSDLTTTAIENYWNSTGVSAILFGKTQTAQSLKISIQADSVMAIGVGKQIERNINRLLKNLSGTYKFQISILPVTIFNQQDMSNAYLKQAQYGIPCKSMVAASVGLSPNDMIGANYLENTFLNLHEDWIPLQSSHTQSSENEEAGRVSNEENGEELTDAGEVTAENESNAERVV